MAGFLQKEKTVNKVVLLPLTEIDPNPAQPRQVFSEKELQSLSDSISENGVLQPILVRKGQNGRYELISGERRTRASMLAGKKTIPAVIMDTSPRQSAVYAILENIQRKDLSVFEEASALHSLIVEWGVSQEEAARRLGKAQSTIANKLRLLAFTEAEKKAITENHLTERHARALLQLPEGSLRMEAILHIAKENLSVAKTEAYVKRLLIPKPPKRKIIMLKDVRIFLNTINKAVDTMKTAGINATAEKRERGDYIEYVVKIPVTANKGK